MKKPNGNIDLSAVVELAANVGVELIKLIPKTDPKQRKIKIAIRRLKHRFKGADIDSYVKVNFAEYSQEEQAQIADLLKSVVN